MGPGGRKEEEEEEERDKGTEGRRAGERPRKGRIRSVDEGRGTDEREGGGREGREEREKKGKMRVKGGTCYVLKKRNNKRVSHDSMAKTLLRL